jgi:hypothetical protein
MSEKHPTRVKSALCTKNCVCSAPSPAEIALKDPDEAEGERAIASCEKAQGGAAESDKEVTVVRP